jgi:hypothetical protein
MHRQHCFEVPVVYAARARWLFGALLRNPMPWLLHADDPARLLESGLDDWPSG